MPTQKRPTPKGTGSTRRVQTREGALGWLGGRWSAFRQNLARGGPSTGRGWGTRRGPRPGWYLLGLLAVYALVVSVQLARTRADLGVARAKIGRLEVQRTAFSSALTWPIVGAGPPASAANLPGAPRAYRRGVSEGFVLVGDDAGAPVAWGGAVVAAGDGRVVRADLAYREPSVAALASLLEAVKDGASKADLDRLRGRQVWLRHPDGTVTRYGHLSSIASNVRPGVAIRRGELVGRVGNSGTYEGARGTKASPRLLFEVWTGERFLGEGLPTAKVRTAALARIKPWP